jgi:hypothetical protein
MSWVIRPGDTSAQASPAPARHKTADGTTAAIPRDMSTRPRHRACTRKSLLFALTGLLAPLTLAPLTAHAHLQNCVPGATGELPIGSPGDPGHAWKSRIVKWIGQYNVLDFTWVEPLTLVDPIQAYGAGYAPNGNLCSFGNLVLPAPWPGVGPTERLHIEQFWLLNGTKLTMPWEWFTHDPKVYTLEQMIDESTCDVRTPSLAWGDSLAFFASWEYAGSPFRPGLANNNVLKRRLAAWLGLQLLMLDFAHYGGTGAFQSHPYPGPPRFEHPLPGTVGANPAWGEMLIGAELSGQLALLAWTFGHVRDILDDEVDLAYQEALLTMAERVHLWNPYYPQTNRGIRSTYGLGYVWEQTQDADAWTWYQATLDQFFTPQSGNWLAGGYWRDDYGLDLGYGGSCLMAGERVLSEDPGAPAFVHDAVATSQELVAHLVLPDVDGAWVSPTAFNARTPNGPVMGTAASARAGYYGGVQRYLLGLAADLPFARAFLRDVQYLGPQGQDALDPRAPDFHENLACLGAGLIAFINPHLSQPPGGGSVVWPDLTRSQDWAPPPTYVENHTTQLLVDLWDDLDQAPQDALMPVERGGLAIRNFADRFVFGRFDPSAGNAYAAALHLGEVGSLAGVGESGFGGGQLAFFWTPGGGPTLLGLRKGRSSDIVAKNDDWTEWRTFPQHAVWVRTAAGNVTTSARIVTPTTEVFTISKDPSFVDLDAALQGTGPWLAPPTVPDDQAVAVLARVSGLIPAMGHSTAVPDGPPTPTLTAPIDYQRTFLMGEAGIWVESTLGAGHAADPVTELWESFPVWRRDTVMQPTIAAPTILLHSSTLGVVDASLGTVLPVKDVGMIEILRDAGDTLIHLDDSERTVQVTGPANSGAHHGLWSLGSRTSQTVLVHRLPPGCAPTKGCQVAPDRFRYWIEELP